MNEITLVFEADANGISPQISFQAERILLDFEDRGVIVTFSKEGGTVTSMDTALPTGFPTLGSSGWQNMYFRDVVHSRERKVDE